MIANSKIHLNRRLQKGSIDASLLPCFSIYVIARYLKCSHKIPSPRKNSASVMMPPRRDPWHCISNGDGSESLALLPSNMLKSIIQYTAKYYPTMSRSRYSWKPAHSINGAILCNSNQWGENLGQKK